ncbi:hypothetical protein ACFP3U_17170 [Kitasatospora misakiensis]|uniref:Uncharacterized protein n=1 Tax=Kitasatospora misakiensis TaxID=67330 RepID=A0ABW0X4N4_9ACTN
MSRDETAGLRAAQLRLGRLPGYVRQPDPARRSGAEGHTYKKGWEVRFTARSEAEIAEIRDLVVAAGFAPARPFFKGHQLIQPVYGMAAVQAYLAARQVAEEQAARTAHERARRGTGAARLRAAAKAAHDAAHEAAREAAREAREDPGRGAAETVDHGTADADTGAGDTRHREHEHERERPAAVVEAAEVADTAGAPTATVARTARRRAAEAFPAQLARSTAPDGRAVPAKTRNTT